jgi:aryl-alcohol dehydrogenase-like predicted oxidoreductase
VTAQIALIGVSNVTLEGLQRALELAELGEVQNAYSVLDRTHQPLVAHLGENLGAAEVELSDADLAALDDVTPAPVAHS